METVLVAFMPVTAFSLPLPDSYHASLILLGAAFLDYVVGDPWNWLHPVQVMGWCISRYSQWAFAHLKSPIALKFAGIGLTVLLVMGSASISYGMIRLLQAIHPIVGTIAELIVLASCFAGKSLRDAAQDVLRPLLQGELSEARSRLSRYVGRDTADLDESEVLRAVVETVAENGVDGVMAPLFWAIVGSFTPIGAAPIALGFKAASTLDSMVGYLRAPYTDLGWCSAKTDDLLIWLPCRLTVVTLGLLSGKPGPVWQLCWRDGRQDPSPNSGWSECVYAAVLGVQLGGSNTYQGQVKHKPLLGNPDRPMTAAVVTQALRLNRITFMIWLVIAIVIHILFPDTTAS
ncbi:adenosylcobinamide-phosphate synthase CbiB [Alkalinema sp. FACHB-956]|uniref:adenosylcobinamide-phosphate synthase CbiB n=1 Tax=Alkalinema sp. FACHB-956 TaxID=2692768 RepID=UPI00321FE435